MFCGEAHESVASFAAAYSLGKQESAAAVNLLRWVPHDIKEGLTLLVRRVKYFYMVCSWMFRGVSYINLNVCWVATMQYAVMLQGDFILGRQHTMPRFINHDGIAEGLLNGGFCSGTGPHLSWKTQLTNNEQSLQLMLNRMESDWCALSPKMRKPWNLKDLVPGFLIGFQMTHRHINFIHPDNFPGALFGFFNEPENVKKGTTYSIQVSWLLLILFVVLWSCHGHWNQKPVNFIRFGPKPTRGLPVSS